MRILSFCSWYAFADVGGIRICPGDVLYKVTHTHTHTHLAENHRKTFLNARCDIMANFNRRRMTMDASPREFCSFL